MKLLWVHKDFFEALKKDPMIDNNDYPEGANETFWGTNQELKKIIKPENQKEWIPFFTMSD
jgi:hypothetical protein